MPQLTLQQCESLVHNYFLYEGWFPPGTDLAFWKEVRVGDLGLDDPPLPSDPNLQRKRVALDLQQYFFVLGSSLASPLGELQTASTTLGDLSAWCHAHQDGGIA